MPELIGSLILIIILEMIITGALGTWIAGEKGRSTTKGLLMGMFLSVIGLFILSFERKTDVVVAQEMYDRNMINRQKYEKTIEVKLNEQ